MSPANSSTFRPRLVCLGLFLGTLLLFSRVVNYGFIDYDDPDFITDNVHVQAGLTWDSLRWAWTSGGNAANWQPLTWASLMLDAQLFGLNPHAFHAVNIFWHALNAVMAFLALRRLTGAFGASAICAALFAWHPLRVESVAWISERKDVLSVFFALLTLWGYAAYAEKRRQGLIGAGRYYALTLVAFALGLLCKAMLVTLPGLLLLLDGWPLRRIVFSQPAETPEPNHWKLLTQKLPFFALSLASCIVTYSVQNAGGAITGEFPLGMRVANAFVSVARYLGKFAWPLDLAVCYSPRHWPPLAVVAAVLLMLVLSVGVFWQRRNRPWLLTGWGWFLGLLVPVIGIVQSGPQAMADRYTYLPMLGIQVALIWTLCAVPMPPSLRWLRGAAAGLVLAGCAARTWNQLGVWRSSQALFEHALAVTSENYLAHCNLATTLLNQGRLEEAADNCQRAIAINPGYGPAYYRLGVIQEKMGRPDNAMLSYRTALQCRSDLALVHYRLGGLLLRRGQSPEAASHFRNAIQGQPDFAAPYRGLGIALARDRHTAEANAAFEQALRLGPNDAGAHNDFANALVEQQHFAEAKFHYEKALHLSPHFAETHFNYANLLREHGQAADACTHYRRAIGLAPADADSRYGLGVALEQLGRIGEALDSYNVALQLNPSHAEAHYNVGALLFNRGQWVEAREHFAAAARIKPTFDAAFAGLRLVAEQLGHLPTATDKNQNIAAPELGH